MRVLLCTYRKLYHLKTAFIYYFNSLLNSIVNQSEKMLEEYLA